MRVRRAMREPEREITFRQSHPPKLLVFSDFTDGSGLGARIAGNPPNHLLYHFCLAYSGFSHAHVALGEESFTALVGSLWSALWSLGSAPEAFQRICFTTAT